MAGARGKVTALRCVRVDDTAGSGFIIRDITDHIERAEFLVFDLILAIGCVAACGYYVIRFDQVIVHITRYGAATPLELVLALFMIVGIFEAARRVIGLAMPRVRDALLTDDLRRSSRNMIGLLKELRNEAIRENKAYFMHFDLDANRFWIDYATMSEEEQARAKYVPPLSLISFRSMARP